MNMFKNKKCWCFMIEKFKKISVLKLFIALAILCFIVISFIILFYKNEPNKQFDSVNEDTEIMDDSDEEIEKELTPEEKYEKAMSLLETDEEEAINILKEIPDYQDSQSYIDNYNFKHRFDGTYFMFSGDVDTAIEKNPSSRVIINGLSEESTIIAYMYSLHDTYIQGNKYFAGRYNDHEEKWKCNSTLDVCKNIRLTSVDENGYYAQTFDENADNIYRISTITISDNLITKSTHYVTKIYGSEEDYNVTFKKLNDSVELPEERQPSEINPKNPAIGMTPEEVRASSWGYPDSITERTYSWGTRELWSYGDKGNIHFENGKVISITEY